MSKKLNILLVANIFLSLYVPILSRFNLQSIGMVHHLPPMNMQLMQIRQQKIKRSVEMKKSAGVGTVQLMQDRCNMEISKRGLRLAVDLK